MRAATASHSLRLASHVRACDCDGQVILLDLRLNRYLGVAGSTSRALGQHVVGWPDSLETTGSGTAPAAVGNLMQRLLSQGLLTDTPLNRTPVATVGEARASLDSDDVQTDQIIGARRLGNFLKSTAVVAWWMRCRSLNFIATAVAARRERLTGPNCESLDAMRRGTAAYARLRPFFYTAQEKCLHDSLALVGFLSTEGALPRWVIGVKTSPFGAHSWVQSGETVLNDQHEYVRRFRPILVV